MPLLKDQLIADAKLSLDFKMTSVDDVKTDKNTAMRVKVQGLGEQVVSMKTEALVRKTMSLHVIEHFALRMGKSFAPFIEEFFPVIKDHLSYAFNKKIRSYAIKCFTAMLGSASEPVNTQMFQACVPIFFQELTTSLSRKDEKVTKVLIKGLANSLRTLSRYNSSDRQFLSVDQINALGPFIKGSLELV